MVRGVGWKGMRRCGGTEHIRESEALTDTIQRGGGRAPTSQAGDESYNLRGARTPRGEEKQEASGVGRLRQNLSHSARAGCRPRLALYDCLIRDSDPPPLSPPMPWNAVHSGW